MRSNLLQQPHSTKTTVTGEATLDGEVILVGGVTVTGGEATLAMVIGGEATTTGGNRWNV